MRKVELDTIISIDITAMFIDEKNRLYPRKLHIKNIKNVDIDGLGLSEFSKQIVNCDSFSIKNNALCDVQDLNKSNIVDHLLEVINSLAYTVTCYKYPNHFSHKDDKREVLINAGLYKELIERIVR